MIYFICIGKNPVFSRCDSIHTEPDNLNVFKLFSVTIKIILFYFIGDC